jgi:O-antigen/teichoic acid export membrane protein
MPAIPADLDTLADDLSTARLASGTRDNLLGALAERVLGIALFLALSFLLSADDLGTYYEIVALVTILVIAGVAGIDVALVRFTALASEHRDLAKARAYVRTGLRLGLVTSVVLGCGLWVSAPWLGRIFGDPGMAWPARLGAVAIPFLVGTYLLVAPARGFKLMWPTVLAVQVCQPGVALVASCGLVVAGLGLAGAMTGFTLAAAASWLLAAAMLLRSRPSGHPTRPEEPVRRPLLRFALPIAGMTFTGTALLWVDTLLLGAFRPATDVATYGIIVRLMAVGSVVLLTVIQIFGPFVTQLVARGDTSRLQETLRTATRWVALVAAPPLVLLAISGESVLRIFRQPTGAGHVAMLVLAAAFLVDAFTGPIGHVLTMSGRSWLNLADNVAALVCNVVLNVLLIPVLGLVGAAISWAVVIVGVNVVRVLQVRSIYRVTPFERSLAKPALALLAAAAAAASVGHFLGPGTDTAPLLSLAVEGGTFVTVYVAALVVQGAPSDDRLFLRTLLASRRRKTVAFSSPDDRSASRHLDAGVSPATNRTSS